MLKWLLGLVSLLAVLGLCALVVVTAANESDVKEYDTTWIMNWRPGGGFVKNLSVLVGASWVLILAGFWFWQKQNALGRALTILSALLMTLFTCCAFLPIALIGAFS